MADDPSTDDATASRRTVLSGAGAVALAGTAGCLGLLSSELNVWVRNDLEDPIDYEVTVDDFEESGSLEGGETQRFEGAVGDPGPGNDVDVSVRFGFEEDEEFLELIADSDSVTVGSDTEAIFARINDRGIFYGPTESE